MVTKRLSTPEPVTQPDQIVGSKGATYVVESVEQCDRHVRFLTARIRRYQESSRFADLIDLLLEDRDLILDKRTELSSRAKTA